MAPDSSLCTLCQLVHSLGGWGGGGEELGASCLFESLQKGSGTCSPELGSPQGGPGSTLSCFSPVNLSLAVFSAQGKT